MQYYMVIIEKGGKNHSAYCPDMPGCITTGRTLEETIRNMEEALCFHIEGLLEDGDPVPPARGPEVHLGEINTEAGDVFTFIRAEPDCFAEAA
ncbi:type II toxin-antitoxin system HicB family antitoxin [Desulfococcaceae bacterium HSG8]|nr:type II toxin-antitoxin system HicB family antitoxin [Desulfococcaceae bacterium HSG8]